MPLVTVGRADVTVQEAIEALQKQLGSRYTVEAHEGSHERIRVGTSVLSFANVHLAHDGGATAFHVHGGGLLIGRLINELGIARTVATAIKQAPGLGAGG